MPPPIVISNRNLYLFLSSLILSTQTVWAGKLHQFIITSLPLVFLDFDRDRTDEHIIFMFLIFWALGISICWNWFNDIGHIIFPFVWCIVTVRIYLPEYLTVKYGIQYSGTRDDIVYQQKKIVLEVLERGDDDDDYLNDTLYHNDDNDSDGETTELHEKVE